MSGVGDADEMSLAAHWRELVTTALLGTDRREPPIAPEPIADLVADTARQSPSERMLAQVAATTAVRRAGVLPGPVLDELHPAEPDDRPVIVPAAAERWHHISVSWRVLEDEWVITLIECGWRLAPDLLPAMLLRYRSDPVRRTRVMVAAGPTGRWLVGHLPDLEPRHPAATVSPDDLATLPELPIAPELARMLTWPGAESAMVLAQSIEDGTLAAAHKAMLVNFVARVDRSALVDLADVLAGVDARSPGYGLASVLTDLATTRHRMLDELSRS